MVSVWLGNTLILGFPAPAEAAEQETQVVPGRFSPSFPLYCPFDSRMKIAGINYVTIEVGPVPHQRPPGPCYAHHPRSYLVTYIASIYVDCGFFKVRF